MNPKVLAVVLARGGSKGVIRKNVRLLADKPLIAWTIEEAKKSKYINKLILSSEDKEIIDVALQYGCEIPFIRPKELAQDDSSGIDVVLHALEQCTGYDYIVLLQPTSPLRTVEDIDGCIAYTLKNNSHFCVSVKKASESPYWMYSIRDEGKMKNIIETDHFYQRRQDLPPAYLLNGAVYVAKVDELIEKRTFLTEHTLAYVMPEERSYDIDSEMDLLFCELILKQKIS